MRTYDDATPTTPTAALTADPDRFTVRLPTGDLCTLTLDELDAAYQAGRIDERTLVFPHGGTEWAELGALAGLAEPAPADAAASEPPRDRLPSVIVSIPTPTRAFLPIAAPNAYPSERPFTTDIGSTDFDDELSMEALRPSKRKAIAIGAVAFGAVLGFVLALASVTGGGDAAATSTPAIAVDSTLPPVVPAPAAAPPVAAASPAKAPPSSPPSEVAPNADARLTEAQRRALADADKAHAAQRRGREARPAPRTNAKNVFHKGGSKFDPLNSSL